MARAGMCRSNMSRRMRISPLGTAGPLGLLPPRPEHPTIVMNGDILTKVAFGALLDFHAEHASAGTMCVRDYMHQVPYGVIAADDHRLSEIVEKPVQRFLVNAGIYVLEPEAIDMVPRGVAYDMTTSVRGHHAARDSTPACFRCGNIGWISVGSTTFHKANDDYLREFREFDAQPLR